MKLQNLVDALLQADRKVCSLIYSAHGISSEELEWGTLRLGRHTGLQFDVNSCQCMLGPSSVSDFPVQKRNLTQ